MIVNFKGKVARDVWVTNRSKALPRGLWIRAKALLRRITFRFRDGEFLDVSIENYHRG